MVRVQTISGSVYLLDREKMTWKRERLRDYTIEQDGTTVDEVRTADGTIDKWPRLVTGESMILFGPPITEGAVGRMIATSPILEVSED